MSVLKLYNHPVATCHRKFMVKRRFGTQGIELNDSDWGCTDGGSRLRREPMSVSIFTSPKGFVDDDGERQRKAIESWIAQAPYVKNIFLLGSGEGYEETARMYDGANGVRVSVEPHVDTNFLDVPLFNSMVNRALSSDTTVAVLINSDIRMLNDVMPGLQTLYERFEDFMAVAARWDVDDPSNSIDEMSPERLREFVRTEGVLHTYGGMDMWAFNVGSTPLTTIPIPPFVYGRGKYDNWLTHQTIEAGLRQVIDVSEALTTVHLNHNYNHVQTTLVDADQKLNYWSQSKKSSWELFLNIHLSLKHGSYQNQMGQIIHAPWRLSLCNDFSFDEPNFCILRRARPGVCPCENSNFAAHTQTDPKLNLKTRKFECGTKSVDQNDDYVIPFEWKPTSPDQEYTPGLPHTMESLLRHVSWEKNVILTAASFDYKEMVMSFVCNLRSLGVKHFLVAAFDRQIYEFLYLRGVPVFYEDVQEALMKSPGIMPEFQDIGDWTDCAYGTTCFRKITKMKSRIVLKILEAGYNVLWSDADIVWFKDHTAKLLERVEASATPKLVIQSNEPDMDLDSNGIRRINSGFYLVKSSPQAIDWFRRIVEAASQSSLSEQPSFYDVLCGVNGEFRQGTSSCVRDGFETELLDRRIYPNGANLNYWNMSEQELLEVNPEIAILHNNWLKGTTEKIARQKSRGWFYWQQESDSCKWPWMQISKIQ
eukprot:TRINITY_DN4569_c0_g1_i1.p1 TRINITY_DN4569_c0_g1~~TRINITY_DN4569_c0_g1_i1.p1  ORF type:complete len:799 (-),score=165.49 TRINITY_DN4569_c0_g1_i1:33-2150(-)